MLIGCCLNMHAEKDDTIGMNRLEEAIEAGYDYIELPVSDMMGLPDAQRASILSTVRKSGIRCYAGNNLFPVSLKLLAPETNISDIREYLKGAMDYCKELGMDILIFGSGGARMRPDNMTLEQGHIGLSAILEMMAGLAESFDITFVLETLRAQESNILNTMAETRKLKNLSTHPRIKMLCDNYHMSFAKETPHEDIEPIISDIAHAHFCRVEGRVIPNTELREDEKEYVNTLKRKGYSGNLSVEAYSQNFKNDSKFMVKQLKRIAE